MSQSPAFAASNESSRSTPSLLKGGLLLQEKMTSQLEKTISPISSMSLDVHYERQNQLPNLEGMVTKESLSWNLTISRTNPDLGLVRKMFGNLWNMYQFSNETRKYAEGAYTEDEFADIEESFCVEEGTLSERDILLGTKFILESVREPLDSDDIADILNISPLFVQKTLSIFKDRKKTAIGDNNACPC